MDSMDDVVDMFAVDNLSIGTDVEPLHVVAPRSPPPIVPPLVLPLVLSLYSGAEYGVAARHTIPEVRPTASAPAENRLSLRMRLLAKEAANPAAKRSTAFERLGHLDLSQRITDPDEWQQECARITEQLERAYADDLEHDDDELYTEGCTVGQVLAHVDRDAERRAARRDAARAEAADEAQREAVRVARRVIAAALKAHEVRQRADAGMLAAAAALEASRSRAAARCLPPELPIAKDRAHEAGPLVALGDVEASCSATRFARFCVVDHNRQGAAQLRANKLTWRREAERSRERSRERSGRSEQSREQSRERSRERSGRSARANVESHASTSQPLASTPSTMVVASVLGTLGVSLGVVRCTSKAALAVHEVHASAARLGSDIRQQRDEQRRQRERQHLEFLVHQRESHEVHGRLQRHRTVEAQREAMQRRAQAALELKVRRLIAC